MYLFLGKITQACFSLRFKNRKVMSDVAIRVEGLSKSYQITRTDQPQRYKTLQEDLLALPRKLLRTFKQPEVQTFWALNNISFEVKQGEVLGIIGRNGAGKSTLLKVLSRITEPTSGRAEIYGRIGSLLEVGTGFHPELTGRENIYLNGAILGMRRNEIAKHFDEIVDFAEVEKFIDTPVKRYSSGMYMRLAFAVAAYLEPEILIVDEVLAVGDAEFQKKCLGKMGEVANSGRTVLFVSHNMTAVRQLCEIGILLNEGRIYKQGDVSCVANDYERIGTDNLSNTWLNKKKYNQNEETSLEKIEILDKGYKESNNFLSSESIFLRFTVDVKEENSNLKIGFDLVKNGTVVFRSQHVDSKNFIKKIPYGKSCLVCEIPGKSLNSGDYSITPLISIHCVKSLIDVKEPVLSFNVTLDSSLSDFHTVLNEQNHPGLVFPLLNWSTD
jgi:lipopolysaccharide transport system ATP-binding protein